MSRPAPKAFADLLKDAVHEPGPMATYPRWRELGRHVAHTHPESKPYVSI